MDISHFLFQYGISRIHDKHIFTSQEEQKKRFFTCFRNDMVVILNGTKCSEESPAMIAGGDSSYSFEMTSSISGSLTGDSSHTFGMTEGVRREHEQSASNKMIPHTLF